jgi:integrase
MIPTTIRPMTLSQYVQVVNQHIIPVIGNIKLSELRPDHIQALYNAKLKGGMSERSVYLMHTILHRALNVALRMGLVIRNSCDAVIKPKLRRKEMKVLDDVQARNLLLAVRGTGFETFFQLEITTGLRIGELFGLKWSDLDVNTRMLQIRRQVQRLKGQGLVFSEPKTAAGRRNVTIGPTTLKMLQQHYKDQQIQRQAAGEKWHDNDLIFPNTVGNPMEHRNVHRFYKEMLSKAGLPDMRFHDLRHTAATLMLKEGINPKIVQERLGHADISLTLNTYSHVLPSMQDEVAGKLDDLMALIEIESELPGVEIPNEPRKGPNDQLQ